VEQADLKLDSPAVVGLGFGGGTAAEMAMMWRHEIARIVSVGAMGFLPRNGEILDQFLNCRANSGSARAVGDQS
jgi:pimeloyl-ACP methyl ester carboxylesterase